MPVRVSTMSQWLLAAITGGLLSGIVTDWESSSIGFFIGIVWTSAIAYLGSKIP